MPSLQNRVAVITGAGRGIGKAAAACFAREKAKLALVDVNEADVKETARALGSDCIAIRADVSDAGDVSRMVSETVKKFGTVDILVNNAGILRDATLLKTPEKDFDAVIAVNLKGVFLCGQACAKVMAEKKYGKIVNISSSSARGNFGQTNYSAAKAGVIGMTKTWALELSKYNINVNAIAPGLISTEMTATIPQEIREKMTARIPLARQGTPDDVAELALFLASDDSSYVQGEVIAVNGGFLM